MARVAANQDAAQAARMRYVYMQHIRTVSRKPGGRLMCEEVTDSRVSPGAFGSHQELLKLDGRRWYKGRYLAYTTLQPDEPAASQAGKASSESDDLEGMDVDLVENLRDNLTNEKRERNDRSGVHVNLADQASPSKDGVAKGLFPLTSQQQAKYVFKLVGQQMMNGRETYHVSFQPKNRDDFDWKGEAFIDVHEFQPVVVYTQMSRRIPIAVRLLLGTNLPGLGFSVTYDRQPGGVWFPVSFGTEFRMRVLFFIARDISLSLTNAHFEQTHADVRILDGVKLTDSSSSSKPH